MVYHKEHNKMAENDLSIRSSAAEYLTYIASTGNTDESIEIRYEDENIRLTQKMMAVLYLSMSLKQMVRLPRSAF